MLAPLEADVMSAEPPSGRMIHLRPEPAPRLALHAEIARELKELRMSRIGYVMQLPKEKRDTTPNTELARVHRIVNLFVDAGVLKTKIRDREIGHENDTTKRAVAELQRNLTKLYTTPAFSEGHLGMFDRATSTAVERWIAEKNNTTESETTPAITRPSTGVLIPRRALENAMRNIAKEFARKAKLAEEAEILLKKGETLKAAEIYFKLENNAKVREIAQTAEKAGKLEQAKDIYNMISDVKNETRVGLLIKRKESEEEEARQKIIKYIQDTNTEINKLEVGKDTNSNAWKNAMQERDRAISDMMVGGIALTRAQTSIENAFRLAKSAPQKKIAAATQPAVVYGEVEDIDLRPQVAAARIRRAEESARSAIADARKLLEQKRKDGFDVSSLGIRLNTAEGTCNTARFIFDNNEKIKKHEQAKNDAQQIYKELNSPKLAKLKPATQPITQPTARETRQRDEYNEAAFRAYATRITNTPGYRPEGIIEVAATKKASIKAILEDPVTTITYTVIKNAGGGEYYLELSRDYKGHDSGINSVARLVGNEVLVYENAGALADAEEAQRRGIRPMRIGTYELVTSSSGGQGMRLNITNNRYEKYYTTTLTGPITGNIVDERTAELPAGPAWHITTQKGEGYGILIRSTFCSEKVLEPPAK